MAVIIRPAVEEDLAQVLDINTYYIRETVVTFAQNPPPLSSLVAKFHDITSRGLPFLVAVETGLTNGDAENRGGANAPTDKVIGYTYLSPFRGGMLSYGPTVELSIFLHPSHTSSGTGSRLLSTLLSLLGPYNGSPKVDGVKHLAREHVGHPEHEIFSPEGGVPVRSVIACMSLDTEKGKDSGEGLRRWYEQRGFVERGRLKGAGFKKGRWIDTVYLQYTVPEQ
ncbi:hypothetical protein L228DRAFT_257482 [Xylona heveae TC161]|uniref:N-acetyltransferase domain-containing protein n=1 Tax=Xylona heveae (strain CBS 132557 / TC161) TaxID=1328760 RepID=A0A165JAE2_XYLHT|nr:hypothetical protein L228DRAFT_257482 [Xylona heveae TC161]KZF25968.1 hypothetical protein L228DRAFT_257482 [Xylona heveae TC161]